MENKIKNVEQDKGIEKNLYRISQKNRKYMRCKLK